MPTLDSLLREALSNWDDAGTLSRIGQELQERNRLPTAISFLERALELEPSDVPAWATLGFAHYRAFRSEEGDATLRKGIEATGSDALRAFLSDFGSDEEEKARLKEEIASTEDPVAQSFVLSNRFYQGEGNALGEMRELVAAHPEEPDVVESFVWVLVNGKRRGMFGDSDIREEGLPHADRRIARHPDRINGYGMRIQLMSAMEDWAGVLEETKRTLERFPDDETVMQTRGRAYREVGDFDRALAWFNRAIGAKPSFAGARVDLGKLLENEGKTGVAEEVFREIPVANRDYPLGPMSLALFLARQERFEEAEKVTIETWPKLPEWAQGVISQQEDAKALLERDAVKAVVRTKE